MPHRRIFYYCYSHDRPTGGQKDTYRHVDILNRFNLDAAVVHQRNRARLTWFDNSTNIVSCEDFRRLFNKDVDYLVLPEDLGSAICRFPGRKVIFNKGVYHGFQAFGGMPPEFYPYHHSEIAAVMTVSDHNASYLQFTYPSLNILRVYPGIDPAVFRFRAPQDKQLRILCAAKSPGLLQSLYHILESRSRAHLNAFSKYEWTVLSGLTEQEVAQSMQEAVALVFLGVEEGLPLTPLEAMLCGCLVAGFKGGPTAECLPEPYRFDYGDVLSMARFLEQIMDSFPCCLGPWLPLIRQGRELAMRFSLQRQEESVLRAWEQIFQMENRHAC